MESRTLCLLALVAVFGRGGSEVVMTIFPEEVIPGITPSFTLRCSAADVEPAIVSLQIKRTTRGGIRSAYQTLATINSTSLNGTVVAARLPGMTANGMLNRVGAIAPVLPYIEITWQNPTVNDLGTYVCDSMMVGEIGGAVPFSAFISVTTQDPVSDSLLTLLHGLRDQVQSMTGQMTGLQAEIKRAHQQSQGRHSGSSSGRSDGRSPYHGGRDDRRGYGRKSPLPDASILHIHVYDNISYVLWRSSGAINADEAMESCSNAGLYLTEINSEAEFRQVVRGLGPFIPVRYRLLLGGQRMDQWLWPHTGQRINYMRGIGQRSGACIAMKKVSQYRMVMDAVDCQSRYKYYLCSVDEPLLQ